jgi:hypothetical protein
MINPRQYVEGTNSEVFDEIYEVAEEILNVDIENEIDGVVEDSDESDKEEDINAVENGNIVDNRVFYDSIEIIKNLINTNIPEKIEDFLNFKRKVIIRLRKKINISRKITDFFN